MNMLTLMIILLICLYMIPWIITFGLRFVLWRYHFKATVGGPFTYEKITLRLPIKMNCYILFQIDQICLKPSLFNWIFPSQETDSILKIQVTGLKVNIMIRDDLETWASNKMELLRMIELTKTKLIQYGLLPDANTLKQ